MKLRGASSRPRAHGRAVDELHGEEYEAILLSHLVDGHHVRVRQTRERLPLPDEPVARDRPLMQDLECDAPVQPVVVAEVHGAHAALSERTQDEVAAEPRGDLNGGPLERFARHVGERTEDGELVERLLEDGGEELSVGGTIVGEQLLHGAAQGEVARALPGKSSRRLAFLEVGERLEERRDPSGGAGHALLAKSWP